MLTPKQYLAIQISLGALLFCIFACGDGTEESFITLEGTVTHGTTSMPMPNVEVCLQTTSQCTSTDETGRYALTDMPANRNVVISVFREGFVRLLLPVQTPNTDHAVNVASLLPNALQNAQSSLLGVEAIADTGSIAFSISNGINGDGINVPGVRVRLSPTSGDGPFYLRGGLPTSDLVSTSENGGGLWVNIQPGDYMLSFQDLPNNCTTLFGFGVPAELLTPIEANTVSILRIECLAATAN